MSTDLTAEVRLDATS